MKELIKRGKTMSEVKEVKENFSIKECWFLCTDKEHCSACGYKNCEEIENCYFKQLQTAQEENKKMREALEEIINYESNNGYFYQTAVGIAKQALS